MKKILFSAVNMDVGGIETALLTILNYLSDNGYKVTLVLEEKNGIFLQNLNANINVIEYKPNKSKNVLIRKVINLLKRVIFILKYKNKFEFSASFATYSNMASFVARTASTNSALWGHADYLELFKNNLQEVKKFFDGIQVSKFKKIVFVSKKACESFIKVYPEMKDKVIHCNNLIDYEKILELSKQSIDSIKAETEINKENSRNVENKYIYTFANIGRHDELQKRLTRIIEATKKLKQDGLNFKVLFIGNGKDSLQYKRLVEQYNLTKQIQFLGVKQNPYPYMKLADSIILSSDYEGYPVVLIEALILNKPIITTNISDAMEDINNKYGKVVEKNETALYETMKDFIQNGYEIKEKFNPKEYNEEIIQKIKQILG